VEVLKLIENEETIIANMSEGSCLGELAILGNIPRTASLRSKGDVQLLVINEAEFLPLVKRHPDISVSMLKLFVERVLNAESRQ